MNWIPLCGPCWQRDHERCEGARVCCECLCLDGQPLTAEPHP